MQHRYLYNCTDKHGNNLSIGRYVNFLMDHAISSKNYIVIPIIILIEILWFDYKNQIHG